jgi:hypothetical protein
MIHVEDESRGQLLESFTRTIPANSHVHQRTFESTRICKARSHIKKFQHSNKPSTTLQPPNLVHHQHRQWHHQSSTLKAISRPSQTAHSNSPPAARKSRNTPTCSSAPYSGKLATATATSSSFSNCTDVLATDSVVMEALTSGTVGRAPAGIITLMRD